MRHVQSDDIFDYYLKGTGQWGVYVRNHEDDSIPAHNDVLREELAKVFDMKEPALIHIWGGPAFYVFPDEASARKFYDVLDQEEKYDFNVYASLHCPERGCLTENT